ncbi:MULTISPECIES: baseplate assembly protein [unclassified Methylococcus]|uniref:baseplate assembly protein n=1 Tax=unclassified Methylococcus TaxID=2618889 RepID=UPI003D7C7AAF
MSLPEPDFIDRDGQAVTQALIAGWEQMTGKTLYPAQVERLLIDLIAYRETLARIGIQEAAKLNLVNFSRAPMLDYLGELVGVSRLPAQSARTVLRFSLEHPAATSVVIPKGTRVAAGGTDSRSSVAEFATDTGVTIPAGAISVEVNATAAGAGPSANGILPGWIRDLIDVPANGLSVTNLGTSYGGLAAEDDERLRMRIKLAPERFAVAGPALAYRWHVLSVSQTLVDVGITSPAPGRVNVYPLTASGLPDAALLDAVRAVLNQDKVRPLTDWVTVLPPSRVPFAVSARVRAFGAVSEAAVVAGVRTSLEGFAAELRSTLGRDLVPSQWIERAQKVPGVYRVELDAPGFRELQPHEWPDAESVTVTFEGNADG